VAPVNGGKSKAMIRRFCNDIQFASRLLKGGVTLGSLLSYPLQRRLRSPERRLNLKSGISIASPGTLELLYLFEEIWIEGCYWKGGEIPAGATVVDLGANVGVFTLSALANGADRVIAVEPSPEMCKYLSLNISSNHFGNVTVVQAACGAKAGEAVLYHRGDGMRIGLYGGDLQGHLFQPLCRTPVITLDDLFARNRVETCHLLKLDCEEAEYDILFNAHEDTLRTIQAIAMEYHAGLSGHDPQELVSFLQAHGFKVERTPLTEANVGYLYANRRA
jgi:FkbM family methyltransferase